MYRVQDHTQCVGGRHPKPLPPVLPQAEAPAPAPRKLTKSEARKAAQVERAKAAQAARSGVLASLAETALPAEQAALLRGSASRGQRPTKRQRLRHELLAQRLGVDLQVRR